MSNIPLRRTTRIARNATKDNENANARPSRVLTRAKALATGATDAPTLRTTAAALAAKPKPDDNTTEKPAGKRKREVLVEVTGVSNNNRKTKDGGKGKGKEDGAEEEPVKPRIFGKATRESLRTVSGPTAHRSTRSTSVSTTTSQATEVKRELDSSSTVKPPRPAVFTRKPSLKVIDEAEAVRATKRRHTEDATPAKVEDESQAEADKIAAELVDLDEVDAPAEEAQLWDDLDADDWDDPAMVSEYVVEVCIYLKQIELQTCPNPDYMANHPELDWEKRGILVDWILQVHARFNLLQETLFLFTNILDRFLSARPISLAKLQLVGITAFFIAAKYEETYAPSVAEIAYLADGQYTVEEILKAERYLLKTLDWDLRYPGPMGWLRRGSKADDCDTKARTVGKYLMEIGCLEWRLVGTLPSLLAAAALWLGRLVLGREIWTPNLEHYMTYTEAELLPTANIMLNYILEPIQHESLYKKYAHKRYLKCSAFMRHWARERWPESTVVDLERDLPSLKEDIRLEFEAKAAEAEAADSSC
ncbi:nime/cyclinb [Lyophyllum atratum]|nr:nime/cyclinb [Lyophyllum atratum]